MSNFVDFKNAVRLKLEAMQKANDALYVVNVSKDDLWTTYLASFPEGTNPIFRERTEHDCNCCKQFIRAVGKVVSINDNQLDTPWNVDLGDSFYQVVADAMHNLTVNSEVVDVFYHYEKASGTDFNFDNEMAGHKWEHFHCKIDTKFYKPKDGIPTALSGLRSNKQVLQRSLEEISKDAIETVLDLISQGSLYRGEEHAKMVKKLGQLKTKYDNLPENQKNNFCWTEAFTLGGASKVRNTSIGTLLMDLSEGKDLEAAVGAFEAMVAPSNYKRPTSLITKGMIQKAQKTVEELGIEDSLQRRYAVMDDLTINNVLFADRSVKKSMNVFDELMEKAPAKAKLDKVNEMSVERFIKEVMPNAVEVQMLLDNSHENNLVSLIAPVNPDAPNILKWDNNFSWAYNGEVTDSIKERVKSAGGNVEGVLRASLSWSNYDDLDIHAVEPNGNKIYYGNRQSRHSGHLDVDMNAGGGRSRSPVENIIWTNARSMQEGVYEIRVNNYSKRESVDVGFEVELECGDLKKVYHYEKAVPDGKTIMVVKFNYSQTKGVEILEEIPSTDRVKEMWGINSQNFHKVKMAMLSPNHWDDNEVGNKHWFFMLDGCVNQEPSRGFFNEFLSNDLSTHRKVFEVLGSKMKTETCNEQLSGVGFSSTQRNHAYFKVKGSFESVIKVLF